MRAQSCRHQGDLRAINAALVNNEGSCFGTATFTVDVDHHGVLTAPLGQLASATANLDVLAAFGFIDL